MNHDIKLITKLFKKYDNKTRATKIYCRIMGFTYKDSVRSSLTILYRRYLERSVKSKESDIRRVVITCAQNNTEPFKPFLNSLLSYCDKENGKLIISPLSYRNPTSDQEKKVKDSWHPSLKPWMDYSEFIKITEKLGVFRIYTTPTAEYPISGFESYTKNMSGIFPHVKVQSKPVPTPGARLPKLLATTGAVTVENYSQSKAGKKGEHHHINGAIVVELRGNQLFNIRHLIADTTGGFYDIAGGRCHYYNPSGQKIPSSIAEYVCGDKHYPYQDVALEKEQVKLLLSLKPEDVILHDVLDFYRQNHHEVNNRFLNDLKNLHDHYTVKEEVNYVKRLILEFKGKIKSNIQIVRANHDDALDTWLKNSDPNRLAGNLEYWHYLGWRKCVSGRRLQTGEVYSPPIFQTLLREDPYFEGVGLIDDTNEFVKNNIMYSSHGHLGANGARGGINTFTKYGVKMTTAHTHTPEIKHGSVIVGHNCVPRVYASGGASSWMQADSITYLNGKRTLNYFINGKFCI